MSDAPDFIYDDPRKPKDDSAVPRFFLQPTKNEAKSAEQGRPVFDEEEMVEVIIPGDRHATFVGLVNQTHKDRWPRHYRAWKEGREAPAEGTALTEWPGITRSEAEELAYFRVKTVEQLANLPDDLLMKVMPMYGHKTRERARLYLEQAQGQAPLQKLQAENERLAADNHILKGQVEDLTTRMQQLERLVGAQIAQAAQAGPPAQPAQPAS